MTGAARPHMWYYYSGDNFGRKEPQLVSFYERDEKEPVVWDTVPVRTSTSIQLLLYSCTRPLLCGTTHVHRGGGGAHPSMPEAGKARRGGELPADRGDLNSVVS